MKDNTATYIKNYGLFFIVSCNNKKIIMEVITAKFLYVFFG